LGFPGIGRSLLGSSASLPHFQMLEKNAQEAQDEQIKQQFSHHREETRQQGQNLEQAFQALGEQPTTQPCPAIDGLKTEAEQMVQQTSSQLVDSVLLGGAAETEHHEIAVYEGLITKAEAMGQQESSTCSSRTSSRSSTRFRRSSRRHSSSRSARPSRSGRSERRPITGAREGRRATSLSSLSHQSRRDRVMKTLAVRFGGRRYTLDRRARAAERLSPISS
jgi:hypothetical protein